MLSYIEISKENLLHNFATMKSLVSGNVKMAAVVKANAYGHGQNEVVKVLNDVVDYFQIDDLEELKLLRKISSKPVLILGYVTKEEMKKVLLLDGILCVYDKEQIKMLDNIAKINEKKAVVHIKIDAYLGRQGIMPENIIEIVNILKKCKNIEVDGIYSHFANIEDITDFSHAQKQIDAFEKAVNIFEDNGFKNLKTHMSASSGMMVWEKENGKSKIVRPGISLYGMWPSNDLKNKFESASFKLKPAMRWITHIAQIKTVPIGYTIGYGLTHITEKITKIAVVPQGYSDGYDRGLSNKGEVLISGKRCKILGRVAMNMFVVDVSHIDNVCAEDEVVLLGVQKNEEITAEEIAEKIDTINYEITTRISPLLKRIVI